MNDQPLPPGRLQRIRTRLRTYASLHPEGRTGLGMALFSLFRGSPLTGNSLARKLGRKLFPSLTLKPFGGAFRVSVNPSDLSQMVIFDEMFVEKEWDLSRVRCRPERVMDFGAHAGFFSALAAHTFPTATLESFEPDPGNFAWLQKQWRLAGAPERWNLHPAAVSDFEGQANFQRSDLSYGGRLQGDKPEDGEATSPVTVIRPRSRIAGQNSPLLLKMDIEGGETALLPDLLPALPSVCDLFLETHAPAMTKEQACSLLEPCGFSVTVLSVHGPQANLHAYRSA